MASEGCMRCIRYLVFVFNFLFWFVGIGLFGVAMLLRFGDSSGVPHVANFGQDATWTLAYVLMAIGGVLTIVGFMGCCGAYQESTCLLGTFFLCLLLMLGGEIAAAIYGFVEREPIRNKYTTFLLLAANEFDSPNRTIEAAALSSVQKVFQCCGAYNYTDYHNFGGYLQTYDAYPDTCCHNTSVFIRSTPASRNIGSTTTAAPRQLNICSPKSQFSDGCAEKFFQWLVENLLWVGIAGAIIAALEVVGMLMAILLCCHLRSLGYETTADTENLMF